MVHPGAEHGPEQLVATLVDQVQVHLAEGRQEPVGVVDGDRALAVVDLDPVVRHITRLGPGPVGRACRDLTDPHALELVLQRHPRPVRQYGGDGLRQRLERADRHAPAVRVRTEDRVRLTVLTSGQLLDLGGRHLLHRLPFGVSAVGRTSAASGIDSHEGRFRASYTHS